MAVYAQRPARLVGQVLSDLFVVVWAVVWAVIGVFVRQAVDALSGPARDTARTAARLGTDFTDAAGEASQVPGVGEQLRRPFDSASATLGDLVSSANHQAEIIERVAVVLGWLVFLIPVSVVIALWLPRRIRFYRQARAAQVFIDAGPDLDLFALRAMAMQPMTAIAAVSEDPVGAWRNGDQRVIHRLADLELRRTGLRMPDLAPTAEVRPAGRRTPGGRP